MTAPEPFPGAPGVDQALFDTALALTADWCAIPSFAGNEIALVRQETAFREWLVENLGAEIVAPVVAGDARYIHARLDIGAAQTVILYNMYDVMPADPEGWRVDPWTGGTCDLPGIGPAFVARGAENNKGPLAGMLAVLARMREEGRLGVNVEILLDGAEETGSAGLRRYLEAPDCPLRKASAGLFPSFCEYGGGPPRLYLGFSGIAKGRIRIEGGGWGGPRRAIHSSNAPWIANPARVLVDALSRFGRDGTGDLGRIPVDPAVRTMIAVLAQDFDPAAELRFRETDRYALEGDAATLLEHVLSTASLNIASLATDPVDNDAVIPRAATARFELRTPPGDHPDRHVAAFRERIAQEPALSGVAVEISDSYPGHRFAADAAGVAALHSAYRATSQSAPQIWPWAIGAAPAYAFSPYCDAFLIGGAGRGGNAHGVDEFLTLEGYARFLASVRHWLAAMADGEV
ncbi:MAG: M20/M25/M40 family metallo-hydrolase [Rhodobiaceae bacterium]|nr:M20/M25/M40 family metallo-hydrolase [Rhodobiaceae bacterium]